MLESPLSRIKQYIDFKGINIYTFERSSGFSNGSFSSQLKKNKTIGINKLENILKTYPELNSEWVLTGNGSMLKKPAYETSEKQNLIPLYDSYIASGKNNKSGDLLGLGEPAEYINAGDWFKDADAAIRIHNDSMNPYYYIGSIVPLKLIKNIKLIVYGCDYMVETDEYRVIKRIFKGSNNESIMAYSTNTARIDDGSGKGRLMFEPFEIEFNSIRKLFFVLGSVRRNHSCWIKY